MFDSAVVLQPPTDRTNSPRVCGVLDLLGIQHASYDAGQVVCRLKSMQRTCLLASATGLVALQMALEGTPFRLNDLWQRLGGILVYAVDDESPAVLDVLRQVIGCARLDVSSPAHGGGGYRVSAEHRPWCGPFSGLHFGPVRLRTDRVLHVEGFDGESERLVAIGDGALFSRFRGRGRHADIGVIACREVLDLEERTTRNIDARACFSRLVPLLMYLKRTFGERSWQAPQPYANLVVDDPVLRPTYGFLDFAQVARFVEREKIAVTLAFIPWNRRRSRREVVDLFARCGGRLALCAHGCYHTKREFGTSDAKTLEGLSGRARAWMDAHREATGLRWQNVMVFPQGIFSLAAAGSLKRRGFLAAVNTEVADCHGEVPIELGHLLQPALLDYGGFPIFTRRKTDASEADFALDLLVGKPCLLVAHHEYFEAGIGVLTELAQRIRALDERVVWDPLEAVLRRSYWWRRSDQGDLCIKLFTHQASVWHPQGTSSPVVFFKDRAEANEVRDVRAAGRLVPHDWSGGTVRFRSQAINGAEVAIEIRCRTLPDSGEEAKAGGLRVRSALRRHLCEFRDDYVVKHRSLRKIVSLVRSVRP